MAASGPTDFVRKNQQHIQQLEQQRQHEVKMAEAAVLAESRQRRKLREKVLSMREEKRSASPAGEAEASKRNFTHSDTMPNLYASPQKAASPPRRCLTATDNANKVVPPFVMQGVACAHQWLLVLSSKFYCGFPNFWGSCILLKPLRISS